MKKILAFLMILMLVFSLTSCKKEIDEQTAAPIDISTEDKYSENSADNQTEEIKQDSAESEKTEISEDEAKGDKAPPCDLTLENTFTEYEVIVTLTKEETDKQKEYTAKDFEKYNIFFVQANDKYYGNPYLKDSYPEYQDRTTLFLYLNEPSKENVLKTVKELEKDERVFAACPNPFTAKNCIIGQVNERYIGNLNEHGMLPDEIFAKDDQTFSKETFSECQNLKFTNLDHITKTVNLHFGERDDAPPVEAIAALPILATKNDDCIKEFTLEYDFERVNGIVTFYLYDPEFVYKNKSTDIHTIYFDTEYYSIKDFPALEEYDIKKIGAAPKLYVGTPMDASEEELEILEKTVCIQVHFEKPTYLKLIEVSEKLKSYNDISFVDIFK